MITRRSLLALVLLPLLSALAQASDAQPYLGNWSNGRGETLVLTAKNLKFARDKAVPYRDVTRASDGKSFQLQVTAEGKVNYFSRFLRLTLKAKDELKMEGAATFNGEMESQSTWFRD
jgi:hypothetical protein